MSDIGPAKQPINVQVFLRNLTADPALQPAYEQPALEPTDPMGSDGCYCMCGSQAGSGSGA
jgi:hypothetical protein